MTDQELAAFIGIADHPNAMAVIAHFSPETRAGYERLAEVTAAITLWQQGRGPKPSGVLLDGPRLKRKRQR